MKNRKTAALALLSVIAIATVMGAFLLTVQATDLDTGTEYNTLSDPTIVDDSSYYAFKNEGFGRLGFGRRGFLGGRRIGPIGEFGRFGAVEVSEEFEQKVTSIAESDTDVQDLLTEGYTITAIRPIIKRVVDADGYLNTKTTNAIVILHKDTSEASGRAIVSVDMESETVTKVVILTRTVIEKS